MRMTVLVPTLGERDSELKRLLESLKDQTYKDFEVMIVSQDNFKHTDNICKHYPELRIKHLFLDRKGLSAARNFGIKNAYGDFIVLSDDDCWYPTGSLMKIYDQIGRAHV